MTAARTEVGYMLRNPRTSVARPKLSGPNNSIDTSHAIGAPVIGTVVSTSLACASGLMFFRVW